MSQRDTREHFILWHLPKDLDDVKENREWHESVKKASVANEATSHRQFGSQSSSPLMQR